MSASAGDGDESESESDSDRSSDRLLRQLSENDASVNTIHTAEFEFGLDVLGEALEGNTHVSEITVDLQCLLGDEEEACDVQPFLHYIRSSQSLRKMSLDGITCNYFVGNRNCGLVAYVMSAIAENHRIQCLSCEFSHDWPHWRELVQLLRADSGLNRLCLSIWMMEGHQSLDDVELGIVSEVFGSSRSLQTFALRSRGRADILLHDLFPILSRCQLSELKVDARNIPSAQMMVHFQMLADLVRSQPKLRRIDLSFYHFNIHQCESLFLALSESQCNRFIFNDCRFDSATTGMFVGIIQSVGDGENCGSAPHTNRNYGGDDNDDSNGTCAYLDVSSSSFDESTAQVLLDCLVGSSLQSLRCGQESLNIADFLNGMMENQSEISLSCLELQYVPGGQMDALVAFIPTSTGLSGLKLPKSGKHNDQLLKAVHQNGSLRCLTFGYGHLPARFRPPLQRNKFLPELLANPLLDETHLDSMVTKTALVLFPTLFRVAHQAPRMARNNILIGLLAVEDGFGPHRGASRHATRT
jgi:hypothetical protein